MSYDKILDQRRRALEAAFFQQRERDLVEELRAAARSEEAIGALRLASGIGDEKLLSRLVSLGVTAEALVALRLVPLVRVAWADGDVAPGERTAVLQAAVEEGVDESGAALALLEQWLDEAPPQALSDAWTEYVQALAEEHEYDELESLEDVTLVWARRVASAAGGFLGVGGISSVEEEALDGLSQALNVSRAKGDPCVRV